MKVAYDYSYSTPQQGFGGTLGTLAPSCPPSFFAFGLVCVNIPIQSAAPFDNMNDICQSSFGSESVPLVPFDQIQNKIFAGYMKTRSVSTYDIMLIWIFLKKDKSNWYDFYLHLYRRLKFG